MDLAKGGTPTTRELIVLFVLGTIALGTFVVLAFCWGVGSTREFRLSSGGALWSRENQELKQSLNTAALLALHVLAVASPPFLMQLGKLLLRGQRSAGSQLVGWVVLLAVGVAVWWCSYRLGVRFGEQRPDYPSRPFIQGH